MEDEYWYNIKNENGSISIEKKPKKEKIIDIDEERKKLYKKEVINNSNKGKKMILISLIMIALGLFLIVITPEKRKYTGEKYRTFMIYMVGSDLETNGKIATYDLNDIIGSDVDLDNNNVILMVGGSKKWHNFVNSDEIGIYELTTDGFKKIKSDSITSMGSVNTLSEFLNYTYNNYLTPKYDMIFWNHGLGAAGIEVDEVSDDYLNILELKNGFDNSPFAKEKLELVIFNNCLAANIHFASVMKNYAEYMVASEEVLYVGAALDRLNFLDAVKKEDSGYDIGLQYINKSDDSMKRINNVVKNPYDSTLSIIDLSKIENVEKELNKFFKSIELDDNYKSISKVRMKTHTYGSVDTSYDTVDLYELSEALGTFSNNSSKKQLQDSLKKAVLYNSTLNDYSNGLSIYFPFYGSSSYISTHLYYFEKLWKNDYVDFIKNYYSLTSSVKRANRGGVDDKVLSLSNPIVYDNNNNISIELNETELDNYQRANIYVFEKKNDEYKLVFKSNEVLLNNNKLEFNNFKKLNLGENLGTLIYENGLYKTYGRIDDSEVIMNIDDNKIKEVYLDSKDKPIGGIVEINNQDEIMFDSISYKLLEDNKIYEEWKTNSKKINENETSINISNFDINNYYVLIEMFDISNDVYYSELTQIK